MKLINIRNYIDKPLYAILNKEVREVIVRDIHADPIDEACFRLIVHVKVEPVDEPQISIDMLAEDLYAAKDEANYRLKEQPIRCTLKDKADATYCTILAIRAISNYDTPDCLIALQQLKLALEKIKSISTHSPL